MATREENRIIQYIAQEGSITRLEHEAIDVPLHIFMDCIASLQFRGWVNSTEQTRKSDSGRDMIINKYTFSKLFEHQKETYLKYLNPQSSIINQQSNPMLKNIKDTGNGKQQGDVQVHLDDTTAIGCQNCGNAVFVPAMRMGRLSALHPKNPHNKDAILRFPTEACSKCGEEVDLSKPIEN